MEEIPSTTCQKEEQLHPKRIIMQDKNQNTKWYNKEEEEDNKLTCLAIPKSANLTTPDESTSKLAPLMSLLRQEKKNFPNVKLSKLAPRLLHAKVMHRNFTCVTVKF